MIERLVLDHGFVRLIDTLGDDKRIVDAARVSYSSGKTLREDAALIDYLMKNEHWSPFEQVVFVFHLKLPIFVFRQVVRHRTARLNEVSGRYSVLKEEFYVPKLDRIQAQDSVNRQGSSGPIDSDDQEVALQLIENASEEAFDYYHRLLKLGVARETARLVLPLNTYTEVYWQMDLRNLFNFLKLRLDGHAQWEAQEYARAIADIVKAKVPVAYRAFETHVLSQKIPVGVAKDKKDS